MEKKVTEPNSLDPPYLSCNQIDKSSSQHWNYFDSSGILQRGALLPDTLGSIHSFSLRDFNQSRFIQPKDNDFFSFQRQNIVYFDDQSPFQVMPFNRGFSEAYDPFVSSKGKNSNDVEVEVKDLPDRENQNVIPKPKGEIFSQNCDDESGQEFKSNSINSPASSIEKGRESKETQPRGSMVKNVTKNIGKLLMKFIWKNRNTLKHQMRPKEEAWEVFLSLIKTWKKQNNITRDFLVSKWQATGEQFKIFRIVAHHFFRKHCLSAIVKSNIRLKRVHFERVHKFDQAISDPRALDYLA